MSKCGEIGTGLRTVYWELTRYGMEDERGLTKELTYRLSQYLMINRNFLLFVTGIKVMDLTIPPPREYFI